MFRYARPAFRSLHCEHGIQVLPTAFGDRVCGEQLSISQMCCTHLRLQRLLWQPGLLRDRRQHALLVCVAPDAGIQGNNRLIQACVIGRERDRAAVKGVRDEQADQLFHGLNHTILARCRKAKTSGPAERHTFPCPKASTRVTIQSRVCRHTTTRVCLASARRSARG